MSVPYPVINDINPWTQAIAGNNQTIYSTTWTADVASDVIVYSRGPMDPTDDALQIVSSSNYTVQFIGDENIVQVTFIANTPPQYNIVTITRSTPVDRLNLYTNTNFLPSMLNSDFGTTTLIEQELGLYTNQLTPRYNVSETLRLQDSVTGLGYDQILPVLLANQIWIKNNANTQIIAANIGSFGLVTLPLSMQNGGTGANLTPSDGGIVYTNATNMEILAGTSTPFQMLQSGSNSAPSWSTSTWPATTTINELLYSSANNVVGQITTADNSVLATNASGVPSFTDSLPGAVQVSVNSLNSGTGASSSTFWRGDGMWESISAGEVPTGSIIDYAGTGSPTGYLLCDGSAVSRATYSALFTAISTTWGVGDGSTTFNLPDLRRSVTVGSGGTGTAVLGNAVGDTGGEEAHAQTLSELASHSHTFSGSASTVYDGLSNNPISYVGGGTTGSLIAHNSGNISFPLYTTATGTIGSSGSGTAANVIQPSAIVQKFIKT